MERSRPEGRHCIRSAKADCSQLARCESGLDPTEKQQLGLPAAGRQPHSQYTSTRRKKSSDGKSLLHAQIRRAYESGAGVVSGDVVVAIEFEFVKGGGNAEPARHRGGL